MQSILVYLLLFPRFFHDESTPKELGATDEAIKCNQFMAYRGVYHMVYLLNKLGSDQ